MKQAAKGRENFRLDANDDAIPSQHATSSTSPIFYPKLREGGMMNSESGSKGLASTHFVTHDVQGGSLQCGPKGFAHAFAEDANEHARAQAINDQIAPLASQIAQENNGSQYGGNTPNFSAIPAPPATFAYGKKVSERISICLLYTSPSPRDRG